MRKEDIMKGQIISDRNQSWLATYVWLLAVSWTGVICASVAWNLLKQNQSVQEIALSEARAYFNKDQAFRLWAASHGGVYVASDERTPPNPYLAHVLDRDIETASGNQLTLMNPAYVVRQMNEEFADLYGVAGHLTSLKPLRPKNAPDDWERKALTAFSHGGKEVTEFTEVNGEPHLRLMRPMLITEKCLKCHAHQGYQVGDVRGGVGVAVPMTRLLAVERQQAAVIVLGHGGLWLIGLLGIGLGTRQASKRMNERKQAEEAVRKLAGQLLTAQEEERRRIAREMHDDLTQRIAVLAIEAGKLEQAVDSTDVLSCKLGEIKDQLIELSQDVHSLSRQLHPSILDDLGLVEALRSECARFSQREEISVRYTPQDIPPGIPKDVALCLYRIAQEGLRNIAKHSAAKEARVSLAATDDSILLSIEDSGVGFDSSQSQGKSGLGLVSMKERARLIGGEFSVRSEPGNGTLVEVWAQYSGKKQ
jgi:signal transduction histidine kinase